ncbi:hypothetical protein V5O48_011014 [Marasmius crinis-equi]|uniref:P-loop containing nucleoside triphosphate hydrolase protein n=1 Tax=Marasmius crinis-equi TaxID=585013 RepID=A0ABR3F771_9AGAR
MDTLKSMFSPLASNTNALQDTLVITKLVVIGGTMETARRVSASAWNGFIDSFFLTAHFNQEDYPYDWLMHWLSKQPAWGRSREFEITTRSSGRHGLTNSSAGDLEDEEEDNGGTLVHGRKKRRVQFMPSVDTTHTIYYRGHWLRITRTKRYPDFGGASIKVSVVARSNDILKKLVLDAKREYEKDAEHRVHIFMADTTYGCWRWNGARQKRPMSSIVLQPGVKDMLLADCKDFLTSEDWYAERGIPFRRGYLLHGVPGSGKTSLIHSLAGELGLDIYVVSLSAKGMSDNTLSTLMGNVPSRCILLLEDLDAAFTRSVSRDASSTGVPTKEEAEKTKEKESDGSTLSLSGLLNSLDGVAAAEGRLLFATTNHIERLDPALSRPGRMDVWVNFGHATKWQAEGIFKCFFPFKHSAASSPAPSEPSLPSTPTDETPSQSPVTEASSSTSPDASSTHTTNTPGLRKPAPLLTEEELNVLAKKFASHIPEDELSVAALQGYLLRNKTRPRECVDEVAEWVEKEREVRKEVERKRKEEKEAQEKEKKEQEAKEKEAKESKKEEAKEEPKEKETKEAKDKETKEQKPRSKSSKSKKTDSTAATPSEASSSTEKTPSSQIEKSDSTDSTSSSSSETENTSGADADEETETVTSEEEDNKNAEKDGEKGKGKEKWVAVKAAPAEPPASEPVVAEPASA